jgi:hypothetical protein
MNNINSLIKVILEQTVDELSINWYLLTSHQLRLLSKSEITKEESFPVYSRSDFSLNKSWRPSTNAVEAYVGLTSKQVKSLLESLPSKTIQKAFARPLDTNLSGTARDLKSFESGKLVSGVPKKQFWNKPSGIFPYDFLLNQLNVWIKMMEQEEKRRTSKFTKLPQNVYFHATTKDLKVGDVVKPYWAEAIEKRSKGVMGPDAGLEAEKLLEKQRPSNKPSRLNCVFAFETPEEASRWGSSSDGRKIVAGIPLGKVHRADMTVLEAMAAQWHDDGVQYDYAESAEEEKAIEEESSALINAMISNYWNGLSIGNGHERWEILVENGLEIVMIE